MILAVAFRTPPGPIAKTTPRTRPAQGSVPPRKGSLWRVNKEEDTTSAADDECNRRGDGRPGGLAVCQLVERVSLTNPKNTGFEYVGENHPAANLTGDYTNENPGALAGATGADLHSWLEWVDLNIQREAAARSLMEAVLACDPRDRIPLMERFIEAMRPGQPVPAFDSVMAEAAFWADMASTAELKAYALACYSRMSASDQQAFLGYVQGRAAA